MSAPGSGDSSITQATETTATLDHGLPATPQQPFATQTPLSRNTYPAAPAQTHRHPSTFRHSLSSLMSSTTTSKPIWESMLAAASVSKSIPTRDVILLGNPGVGKSTLVQAFERIAEDAGDASAFSSKTGTAASWTEVSGLKTIQDLGLTYSYLSVYDDDHEDILSRVGIYQLSTPSSILPLTLSHTQLSTTLVCIVLDWTRPWAFLQELLTWINFVANNVQQYVAAEVDTEAKRPEEKAANATSANQTTQTATDNSTSFESREEREDVSELWATMKRKLHIFWQRYKEPQVESKVPYSYVTPSAMTIATSTTASASSTTDPSSLVTASCLPPASELPDLPSGLLTANLGIPLVIVCSKSDHMDVLSREYPSAYHDDTYDFLQQVLRTFCYKTGAALFYTSTQTPSTIAVLYQYLLHRLFYHDSIVGTVMRFPYKAQIIERHTVRVPSGWDSWNKIRLLNEEFEVERWYDEEELLITSRKMKVMEGSGKEVWRRYVKDPGGRKSSEQLQETQPSSLSGSATSLKADDEQMFLQRLGGGLNSLREHKPEPERLSSSEAPIARSPVQYDGAPGLSAQSVSRVSTWTSPAGIHLNNATAGTGAVSALSTAQASPALDPLSGTLSSSGVGPTLGPESHRSSIVTGALPLPAGARVSESDEANCDAVGPGLVYEKAGMVCGAGAFATHTTPRLRPKVISSSSIATALPTTLSSSSPPHLHHHRSTQSPTPASPPEKDFANAAEFFKNLLGKQKASGKS